MTDPTPLSTLLGELDALVGKMTPGPWKFIPAPDAWSAGGNEPSKIRVAKPYPDDRYICGAGSDENLTGIVALVNAYRQLREGIASEKREKLEWMSQAAKAMAENERLRALVAQQQGIIQALIDHGECRENPDADDWPLLCRKARAVLATEGDDPAQCYDRSYGDDVLCTCGHPYYRHFDTYDQMAPVGCKYCGCSPFVKGAEGDDHA